MTQENTQTHIEVEAKDLPLYCPMPDMPKWNAHPRVVIPVGATGQAQCPYCGTTYVLKGGPAGHGH